MYSEQTTLKSSCDRTNYYIYLCELPLHPGVGVSCIFISLLLVIVGIVYNRVGSSINVAIIIWFDGENISFDASLVIYTNSTDYPPIMIINMIDENQNLLYIFPLMRHYYFFLY